MGKLTINGIDKLKYSEFWTQNLSILDVIERERWYEIILRWKGKIFNVSLIRDVEMAPDPLQHSHPYKVKLGTFIAGKTIVLNYVHRLRRPESFIYLLDQFMEDCSK